MAEYNFTKTVNSTRLQEEIISAGLTTIDHINTAGTAVTICFPADLSAGQQTTLSTVVSSHVAVNQKDTIDSMISNAQAFGAELSRSFISDNVSLGITQLGLTGHVRKTLREVKDAIDTGSLYDAVSEIKNLDPASFDSTILTPVRLLAFRNAIETYLHVPLASAWNDTETWL